MNKLLRCMAILLVVCSACGRQQANAPTEFQSMDDLRGHTVALLQGSVQDLYMESHYPEVNVLKLGNPSDVLLATSVGKADFGLYDEAAVMAMNVEEKGLKTVFIDHSQSYKVAFAFPKGASDLCEQYNAFFAEFQSSGRFDSVFSRWLVQDVGKVEMPEFPRLQGDPIRVATMGTDMPFSFYKEGGWFGSEAEILNNFAQYVGRPIEFQDYNLEGGIASLVTGKQDIFAAFLFVTEERSKSVRFGDPYFESGTAVLAASNREVEQAGFGERVKTSFHDNLIEENRWKLLVQGLGETVIISLGALLLGTLLGAALCWQRMRRNRFVSGCAKVYVDIMRGVPILVFLMVMFYLVFGSAHISATWVAIFAFALNFAAYVSEMFRSAIASVDPGQSEAGWAMGFSRAQTFFHIVAPQAVRQVMPVYKGEAVSLIKNTSIVGYIAIQDLTKMSDIIRSRTFDAFFPLIIISIIYFIMAWLLGLLLDRLVCDKHNIERSSK